MNRRRVAFLVVIAAIAWGLKRHYAMAAVENLTWILAPVAKLSAVVSGTHFEWASGEGYLSRERLFLIAKPCAGINFMIAAFGMVAFLLSNEAKSARSSAVIAGFSLVAAYLVTIFANTVRIAVALWLAAHPLSSAFWTAARVHRVEGVVVYFGALVALHALTQYATARSDGAETAV